MTEAPCSPMNGPNRQFTTYQDGTYQGMTREQELHLRAIKDQFARDVEAKYRNGVREHGGNLWEKSALELINEAIKESIDQYVYLVTARGKLL